MVLLLLLLIRMIPSQSIEILDSGQIYASSESIGTLLHLRLFNPFSRSIRISAVVERCCTSEDHCVSVRLLGGHFGQCKSKTNHSMTFLWSGTDWQQVTSRTICEISLFYGFRSQLLHERHIPIRIHYIPVGLHFTPGTRHLDSSMIISSDVQSEQLPFQTASSPYHLFPRCNHYLNPRMNQCETLRHLRDNFSMATSSAFIPFDHRKDLISATNHRSRYPRLHQLLVATVILFLVYVILLVIVVIFICSELGEKEDKRPKSSGDDGFSLIELPSSTDEESDGL